MTNPPPYPGGQQPHDPYQTGQPYQAGQPYQQGQPYQPGQSPYPAIPAGGFTPPPKKSSLKWLWILLGVFGVIGVVIVAGVIALAVFATKDNVSDSDDVAIGDCVRVERTTGNDVKPKKIDCGTSDFHFSVASKADSRAGCGGYDYLYFRGTGDGTKTLCLVREMAAGKCYEWPLSSATGSLADIKEIPCGGSPTGSSYVAVRVESRESGLRDCAVGQQDLTYDKPPQITYCLTVIS